MELNDFLLHNYFMFFYIMALVVSIYRYGRYYDTPLKYLPILIGYTLFSEILGYFILEYNNIQIVYAQGYSYYNNLIYNIFDIIFFFYFYYVFWKTIKNQDFKGLIRIGGLLFILSSLINPFFQDFVLFPQIWASTVGSIVLIMCIILYFIQTRSNSKTDKYTYLLIWIGRGLLVFYIFYPIILLLGHYSNGLYEKLHIRAVQHLLIALMYLCITVGFIRLRKTPSATM